MKVVDHVLRYLRDTYELGIKFHRDVLHPDTLWVWVNTDWVGDADTHCSHTVFVLMTERGTCFLVITSGRLRDFIYFGSRIYGDKSLWTRNNLHQCHPARFWCHNLSLLKYIRIISLA